MSCPNTQVAPFQSPHVHVCVGLSFTFRKHGQVPHVGTTLLLHLFPLVDAVPLEEAYDERAGRGILLVLHPQRDTRDKTVQAPTELLSPYLPPLDPQNRPHNGSLRSPRRVST